MTIRWTDRTTPPALPTRPARTGASSGAVDVWIAPAVEARVLAHLGGADVERGGLLIGRAFVDPADGRVCQVLILDSAAADESDGTGISLRMGATVWTTAQQRLAPDRLIVGWYHSHPGLTAFFSETDRRTQRAFFHHAYSVGWVVDPVLGQSALFIGPDSRETARCPDPPADP